MNPKDTNNPFERDTAGLGAIFSPEELAEFEAFLEAEGEEPVEAEVPLGALFAAVDVHPASERAIRQGEARLLERLELERERPRGLGAWAQSLLPHRGWLAPSLLSAVAVAAFAIISVQQGWNRGTPVVPDAMTNTVAGSYSDSLDWSAFQDAEARYGAILDEILGDETATSSALAFSDNMLLAFGDSMLTDVDALSWDLFESEDRILYDDFGTIVNELVTENSI